MLAEDASVRVVRRRLIGTAMASARASAAPRGTSRQPRFGAIETRPSLRRTMPATATPMPTIGQSAAARAGPSASAARSATIVVDRELAARAVEPDVLQGRPPRPTIAAAIESTSDLEAEDDGARRGSGGRRGGTTRASRGGRRRPR